MIASKMSKSKPKTCIFVHDSDQEIRKKIRKAYCPEKDVKNPILDYTQHILFRAFNSINITRPRKYGGDILFESYEELEDSYRKGELYPLDLKNTVAELLIKLIRPIREHFEKNKYANELYSFVKQQEVTR
jgi:tyrosyl-tRNA synthetase